MIKQIRKRNRMTQKQLASLVSITQSYLCKIEKNKVVPSLNVLVRISQRLNICLFDLVAEYCFKI